MDIEAALAYSEKHALHALLVERSGTTTFERYAGGFDATKPHALYSGTKSFWGIAALEAEREGILHLDDVVVDTVSVRMLLQMTAGYGFGGLGNAVPSYDKAIAMPLKSVPGERFAYGGIPLQVFGGFFARRLSANGMSPVDYLKQRVLAPAGVEVASWRILADGTNPLPTGAQLTGRNWLAYGRFVLQNRARYTRAFEGSRANARYGLGWWLAPAGVASDIFYASGSGGQGLYVAPSLETVAVHFGKSAGYKHEAFLKRLFAG